MGSGVGSGVGVGSAVGEGSGVGVGSGFELMTWKAKGERLSAWKETEFCSMRKVPKSSHAPLV